MRRNGHTYTTAVLLIPVAVQRAHKHYCLADPNWHFTGRINTTAVLLIPIGSSQREKTQKKRKQTMICYSIGHTAQPRPARSLGFGNVFGTLRPSYDCRERVRCSHYDCKEVYYTRAWHKDGSTRTLLHADSTNRRFTRTPLSFLLWLYLAGPHKGLQVGLRIFITHPKHIILTQKRTQQAVLSSTNAS